jgi:phosphopantetheinyl transferase (holo-ACP synthase)
VELNGYLLEKYGNYKISVSLSHTQGNGVAFVIMED